ncbi:MAG: hypothetical protein FWF90_03745 [Promicromonosporaceae bacterium]|nr:hypothetical protein [Promicromonosporaceae bacterium]
MNAPRAGEIPAGDLTDRIEAALRSREPSSGWTASAADRIAASLAAARSETAAEPARVVPLPARHAVKIAATGAATAVLVGGVGVGVAAANPFTGFAAGVENVAGSVGLDVSFMPAGYTRAQYDAFWGAGFAASDVDKLASLWHVDGIAAKAKAGQAVIDGTALPIQPDTAAAAADVAAAELTEREQTAVRESPYTHEAIVRLEDLWHLDPIATKARLGDLLLAHKPVPVTADGTLVSGGK